MVHVSGDAAKSTRRKKPLPASWESPPPDRGTSQSESINRNLDGVVNSADRLEPIIERIFAELAGIRAVLNGKRKDFYTTAEVARATGRSEYTVRRWVAEGLVEAIRVDGTGPRGRLLIPRTAFEKLVAVGLATNLPATSLD